MLWKILGSKKEEVTGDCRKLFNDKLPYCIPHRVWWRVLHEAL